MENVQNYWPPQRHAATYAILLKTDLAAVTALKAYRVTILDIFDYETGTF